MTLTCIVQEESPSKKPFVNLINWVPETASNVPPQLLTGAGAEPPAITKPFGNVSVIPILTNSIFPVFWMVIVNNEKEFAGIELGEKNLLILAPGKFVSEAWT